jgi:hypothetical protein
LDRAAKDDKERSANRRRLMRPPEGAPKEELRRTGGVTATHVNALLAMAAADDA